MNLLIFVLTFLFLIASISYQSLAHYKANAEIRGVWDQYMYIENPCIFNRIVDDQYRKFKQTKGKPVKEEGEKKEEEEQKAASAINFRFLIDPNYPTVFPQATEQMDVLVKRLITLLYGDQPFFQELAEKRPNFLDELIPTLRASDEEHLVTSKKKLQKLILKDPDLNDFWYQLRKENPVSLKVIQQLYFLTPEEIQKMREIPCYEVSLLHYLSNSNVQQLRLYLASRPILMALLENGEQVNEILAKRKELHGEVVKKTMTQEEATQEFQTFSQKFSNLSHFETILNYKVTTTNPADYE